MFTDELSILQNSILTLIEIINGSSTIEEKGRNITILILPWTFLGSMLLSSVILGPILIFLKKGSSIIKVFSFIFSLLFMFNTTLSLASLFNEWLFGTDLNLLGLSTVTFLISILGLALTTFLALKFTENRAEILAIYKKTFGFYLIYLGIILTLMYSPQWDTEFLFVFSCLSAYILLKEPEYSS